MRILSSKYKVYTATSVADPDSGSGIKKKVPDPQYWPVPLLRNRKFWPIFRLVRFQENCLEQCLHSRVDLNHFFLFTGIPPHISIKYTIVFCISMHFTECFVFLFIRLDIDLTHALSVNIKLAVPTVPIAQGMHRWRTIETSFFFLFFFINKTCLSKNIYLQTRVWSMPAGPATNLIQMWIGRGEERMDGGASHAQYQGENFDSLDSTVLMFE
jgi:hypothetical protein